MFGDFRKYFRTGAAVLRMSSTHLIRSFDTHPCVWGAPKYSDDFIGADKEREPGVISAATQLVDGYIACWQLTNSWR